VKSEDREALRVRRLVLDSRVCTQYQLACHTPHFTSHTSHITRHLLAAGNGVDELRYNILKGVR